jgi:hypothetical protein
MEVEALRLLIRERLRDVRLALDHPRFWGGPSEGEQCDACGRPILDSMGIEGITSAAGGKKSIQLHVVCFSLWDEERREPREDAPRTHVPLSQPRVAPRATRVTAQPRLS